MNSKGRTTPVANAAIAASTPCSPPHRRRQAPAPAPPLTPSPLPPSRPSPCCEGLHRGRGGFERSIEFGKCVCTWRTGFAHYRCQSAQTRVLPEGATRSQTASGPQKKWNGKDSPNATKICRTYNFKDAKHPDQHLFKDGTCKFRHVCMQWVAGKGAGGCCEGDHPKFDCKNPGKCAKPEE